MVGRYCVTITWQQTFKGSLVQIMVEGVLLHVTVERRHLGMYCSETVSAHSGKARRFILCEKSMNESVAMLPQV